MFPRVMPYAWFLRGTIGFFLLLMCLTYPWWLTGEIGFNQSTDPEQLMCLSFPCFYHIYTSFRSCILLCGYSIGLLSSKKFSLIIFIKILFYLFLERGEGREKEGEKHQCVVSSHVPSTGDPARNPGLCPDWESNWQPFGSQAGTQFTESHQLGL